MSKIVEIALEIEKEMENLQFKNEYLTNELHRANQKNKQVINLIGSFLSQIQEVIENE